MQEVIIANPELSAGQKIGIVASFVIFAIVAYVIYYMGSPRK